MKSIYFLKIVSMYCSVLLYCLTLISWWHLYTSALCPLVYTLPNCYSNLSPSNLEAQCISCCCRILQIPTEELQHHFDTQLPESVKELLTYARNFLEFCSYQALHIVSCRPDYLSDKEFRCMTFDMMLAWESPSVESKPQDKVRQPLIVI